MNFGLLDPKRRVLGWLRFDSANGKILGVHPHFSTEKKFVYDLRLNIQHVRTTVTGILCFEKSEIIILAGYLDSFPILTLERFPFRFQQAF